MTLTRDNDLEEGTNKSIEVTPSPDDGDESKEPPPSTFEQSPGEATLAVAHVTATTSTSRSSHEAPQDLLACSTTRQGRHQLRLVIGLICFVLVCFALAVPVRNRVLRPMMEREYLANTQPPSPVPSMATTSSTNFS
jgi:hypothetical protein